MATNIVYLVHDLGDAAVARRVTSFGKGDATVSVAGFFRRSAPDTVAGKPAFAVGRTHDAKLIQRALLVFFTLLLPGRLRHLVEQADIVVARNLEMLLIANRLRREDQQLVYECLDIHRLMLRQDRIGKTMRALERWALRRTDLLIVSSPAFERDYFRAVQGHDGEILLVENKVRSETGPQATEERPRDRATSTSEGSSAGLHQPWTIGWFGMIRCSRSLDILSEAVERAEGKIELLLAGIPSVTEFDDFHARVSRHGNIRFVGKYDPSDLPELYRSVHFSWCIDYFEEGLNSRWLLPNRLYESLAHGAVPVALSGLETGHWLRKAGVGICLRDGDAIGRTLEEMSREKYLELRKDVREMPRSKIAFDRSDDRRLVRRLAGART